MSETESAPTSDSEQGAAALPEALHGAAVLPEVLPSGSAPRDGGVDKLLANNRSEILAELERIQQGARPVTGQGRKEAVEELFMRAQQDAPTAEVRPDAVVVEVQGLIQRRPVSSILQSAGFRRRLENIVRGGITTVSAREVPRSRPSEENTGNESQGSSSQSTLNSTTWDGDAYEDFGLSQLFAEPEESRTVQTVGRRPTGTSRRRDSHPRPSAAHRAVAARAAAAARSPASYQFPSVPAPGRHAASASVHGAGGGPVPVPRGGAMPVPPPAPHTQAWLTRHAVTPPLPEDPVLQREVVTSQRMETQLREDLVAEISQLVQRHLVTETLTGTFRGRLESHVGELVESTGSDGQRVIEYLSRLPRTGVQRNDFSHLGVAPPDQLSDDAVSVISATAAVHVQQQAVSRAVSLELAGLRAQVAELQATMRLSFDLQLDIQRAIRQEVAAAVSAALPSANGPTAATNSATAPVATPVAGGACLICLEQQTDAVLYQCGHMCVCYACGLALRQRGAHCPMCRAPIRDIIRAYRCGAD